MKKNFINKKIIIELVIDIVFLLLPYAYVTMQLPVLLDAIQSGSKKMLSVSNDLLNEIENLYGENNG